MSHRVVKSAGIFELLQAEIAFTCSADPNPILAADALFSNVAVFGFEKQQKVAFGSQFHDAEHIQKCFNRIIEKLEELVDKKTALFSVVIFGGEIGKSEDMITCARKEIAKSSIKMQIIAEAILKNVGDGPLTIAMDTRTGEVTRYDERKNPKRRTDYLEHMNNFVHPMTGTAKGKGPVAPPSVKVAYFPFATSMRDADELSVERKNKIYYEQLHSKKDKDDSKSSNDGRNVSFDLNDPNICCIC